MARREPNVAANVWVARIIPVILAGVVGYATYVLVARLCVDYLLKKHNDKSAAIPILVIYFILFLLMSSAFFRLVYITTFDPPYTPLGPQAIRNRKSKSKRKGVADKEGGIGGAEYDADAGSGDTSRDTSGTNSDPDSPGLELFYTKDVFVCERDGKPKWCSECMNWKPDRTHHCSSAGRCIQKMDHFCPWVGGPIGENNFKFFVQFTGYTALYTLHLLIVMAIYISKQKSRENEGGDRQFIAILALAAFFFLFTAGMTMTSFELLIRNLTQVEKLAIKSRIETLAILEPTTYSPQHGANPNIHPNNTYYKITYPLGAGQAPGEDRGPIPEGRPLVKAYDHTERPASDWSQAPILPAGGSIDGNSQQSAQNVTTAPHATTIPNVPLEAQLIVQQSQIHSSQVPEATSGIGQQPISDRDRRAMRTFAILNMVQAGDNPWDLGSALANWEAVMGYRIIDWFLPIRRSPCCNHENGDSWFMVGPAVDKVRAAVGFCDAGEAPERIQRLKNERGGTRGERRDVDNVQQNGNGSTEMRHLGSNV